MLRPSPNHGTLQLPSGGGGGDVGDDDDDDDDGDDDDDHRRIQGGVWGTCPPPLDQWTVPLLHGFPGRI